jgi:hypothetical protein
MHSIRADVAGPNSVEARFISKPDKTPGNSVFSRFMSIDPNTDDPSEMSVFSS